MTCITTTEGKCTSLHLLLLLAVKGESCLYVDMHFHLLPAQTRAESWNQTEEKCRIKPEVAALLECKTAAELLDDTTKKKQQYKGQSCVWEHVLTVRHHMHLCFQQIHDSYKQHQLNCSPNPEQYTHSSQGQASISPKQAACFKLGHTLNKQW